jgi:alkanesulfonate monooxygenase SsuD/methylene tetrahydromethanopterin reductase-like flavin-dependent oxidoreductase (luciferase family)
MKFGIFDHVDRQDLSLAQTFTERMQLVELADALGFYCYHVAEHHMTPLGMAPSPSVYLAAVSQHSKRMRLGPLVYLLPLYHPLRLIEEICMLDHLSGGRLDVGVGRGVSPYELAYYGCNFLETHEIFAETLEVMLKGLTADRLDHKGERYRFSRVPMELRPLQQPGPPLWYGIGNDESIPFAAQHGMNIVSLAPSHAVRPFFDKFRDAWETHKDHPDRAHSPVDSPFIGLSRHLFVADTDHAAEQLAAVAYEQWAESFGKLWLSFRTVHAAMQGGYAKARSSGAVIVGSTDTVCAEIAKQIDESGCNYMIFSVAWGNMQHADARRSVELFGSEVIRRLT